MTLCEHDRTLWHIDDVHASRVSAREDLVPPKVSTVPSAVTTSPTRPGLPRRQSDPATPIAYAEVASASAAVSVAATTVTEARPTGEHPVRASMTCAPR